MDKNKSIKLKIFLYLTVFSLVLIVLLWFFQVVFLDSFYKWIKTQGLKSAAATIEKNISSDDLAEIVAETALNYETCILIVSISNPDAEPISHHIFNDCSIHKIDMHAEIDRVRAAGGEILEEINNRRQNEPPMPKQIEDDLRMMPSPFHRRDNPSDVLNLLKILNVENGGELILAVGSTITPVNSTVQTLQVQLYFVTGFMLVISTAIAVYLSRKVARPIERINKEAGILAAGNYDVAFSGGGYREIDELSGTLNYAASELKKTDMLQKELIANISHDLRTPLTLIAGYAEAMRDLPGELNAENAQVIIDEAMRLNSLVKDVLDVSKIQSGITRLDLKPFNITAMIREDIGRMGEFLNKEGYSFLFDYEDEAWVIGDEAKISQVLYNLIHNAVHYTGADKKINIRQMIEAEYVKIEITDTGAGIDKNELESIWDRYYKSKESHRRSLHGSGIGLSIVKSIMNLHGYPYGVTSEKGKGSTFYVCFKRELKPM